MVLIAAFHGTTYVLMVQYLDCKCYIMPKFECDGMPRWLSPS